MTESIPLEFQRIYAEYMEHKRREDCPKEGVKQIRRTLSLFYGYLFSVKSIEQHSGIRKTDIKEFTRYLTDLTKENGEVFYTPASINRRLSDLKTFLNWLSKKSSLRGYCSGFDSYAKGVRREDHISRNILTRKEIVKLFSVRAESSLEFMVKTVIVLLYASGVRIGEALTLRMRDVDLEKKEATIFETKTNKERTVQLGDVAAEYLKLFINHIRGKILHGRPDNLMVFVSNYEGKTLNRNSVNLYIKRFRIRAGIKKDITCHSFRHSFGTHLMENGAGIKQAGDLLGHKDLLATARYTRLNPEHLRMTILKYHPLESERSGTL